MTVTLTPEQEQRLARAAQGRGLDSRTLLAQALDDVLARLETTPLQASLPETSSPLVPLSPPRTPGLHAGQYWISDDFDAPLPDSFWLGEQ